MYVIKTAEPLLIEGQVNDHNYNVLPVGTVMYRDKGFSEGFTRYIVYFNYKGPIAHEEAFSKAERHFNEIDPTWLSRVDADTLKEMFTRFPLSKEDVSKAVKANEITKEDLIDIIRAMPD